MCRSEQYRGRGVAQETDRESLVGVPWEATIAATKMTLATSRIDVHMTMYDVGGGRRAVLSEGFYPSDAVLHKRARSDRQGDLGPTGLRADAGYPTSTVRTSSPLNLMPRFLSGCAYTGPVSITARASWTERRPSNVDAEMTMVCPQAGCSITSAGC